MRRSVEHPAASSAGAPAPVPAPTAPGGLPLFHTNALNTLAHAMAVGASCVIG